MWILHDIPAKERKQLPPPPLPWLRDLTGKNRTRFHHQRNGIHRCRRPATPQEVPVRKRFSGRERQIQRQHRTQVRTFRGRPESGRKLSLYKQLKRAFQRWIGYWAALSGTKLSTRTAGDWRNSLSNAASHRSRNRCAMTHAAIRSSAMIIPVGNAFCLPSATAWASKGHASPNPRR